jgi:hypothetical protein
MAELRKSFARVAMALALLSACVWSSGCGGPTIGSEAFELAKALDNLCNLQNESQLAEAVSLVEKAHAEGRITDREQRLLAGILTRAEDGDWARASSAARDLLQAQTEG